MIIAVPYENGQISDHFGRTEQFKIYDVQDGKIADARVETTEGRGHFYMVQFLVGHGVKLVLCQSMGSPARSALDIAGISLITGEEGDADAAVLRHITGTEPAEEQ